MQSPQTSSSRTGGKRSGVTIISSQRSDMTAAGQSIVRTSFPTRSDKRHPTPVAPFKQGTEGGGQGQSIYLTKQPDIGCTQRLNDVVEKLDTGSGRGVMTSLCLELPNDRAVRFSA
jgi:hypothetical protein